MSLIKCPDCGNDNSSEATTCPNCGRPLITRQPVIQREVVVAETPREEGFPKWLIAPIVILCAVAIFLLFIVLRNSDENSNANMRDSNIAIKQRSSDTRDTSSRAENPPNQVDVPSSSTTVNPPSSTTIPQPVPQPPRTEVSTPPTDKGTVIIDAKVASKEGKVQSVKNEKFYLLDKDLDTILSDAKLEPIEGQSMENSFGLAVLYPEKYGNFQRNSLNAIKKHIKYNAITDNTGKASIKNVKPDSYYLFGITKSRTGFAIWNSSVSIISGENTLNLSPPMLNEMSE